MLNIRVMLIVVSIALLLGACSSVDKIGDLFQPGPGAQKLSGGIKSYEEGDYKSSQESIQKALEMGLSSKDDLVSAHKYLAFIHCVSAREKQCRDEFRRALEIDSNFDLKPAEAGHPVWGPVFRSVKGKPAK